MCKWVSQQAGSGAGIYLIGGKMKLEGNQQNYDRMDFSYYIIIIIILSFPTQCDHFFLLVRCTIGIHLHRGVALHVTLVTSLLNPRR